MIGVKAGTAVAAAVAVVESLNGVAQQLAVLAGIAVSAGILFAVLRRAGRGAVAAGRWVLGLARKVDAIFDSTIGLRPWRQEVDEWRQQVDERLVKGSDEFLQLRDQLQELSNSERAVVRGAVRGALEAVATPTPPRPARRTDEIAERD